MLIARQDLGLEHLWVIYPGKQIYPVHEQITCWPLQDLGSLYEKIFG